jgi:hypothetical protein
LLRSENPNADIRYLVEVDEEWQGDVLAKAFEGHFDMVADLQGEELKFIPTSQMRSLKSQSKDVARQIRSKLLNAYASNYSKLLWLATGQE